VAPALTSGPGTGAGAPGPGSITWRLMGDARGLLLAPTALVLQVAHPVVGAGVAYHSAFPEDAWGRLVRTIGSAVRFTYGSDEVAGAEADRLRAVHRPVHGVDSRGRPYRASDPAAYAWVHLTLAHLATETRRWFGPPLATDELDEFYGQWRYIGKRLGVREEEMPPAWADFVRYFETMVTEVLEVNDAVLEVLSAVSHPPSPASWLPEGVWEPVAAGAGAVQSTFTLGTIPARLREATGARWTPLDDARLRALAGAVRVASTFTPTALRYVPQAVPYVLAPWRARRRRLAPRR
jgi:uncharacterized protein (DUF2236 family)